jgi:hypothetical protein
VCLLRSWHWRAAKVLQRTQVKIRPTKADGRLSEKMMEHEGEESYRVSMRDIFIL